MPVPTARSLVPLVVLAAFLSWVSGAEADCGESVMESIPSLTVRGSAEVSVAPDRATVRLGVLVQRPQAAEAQREANEVAGRILRNFEELGVEEDQIQTSELQLSPVYAGTDPRASKPEEPRIAAYRASNVVSVRLDDLSKIGPAIDAGLAAGANRLEGVHFGLKNDLPAREDALRQAVGEARSKAKTMADALGVRLVEVLSLDEGGVTIDVPRMALARGMAFAEASDVPTPVASGQITVSAQVTLRYRIEG